jgi:hypothetical protein
MSATRSDGEPLDMSQDDKHLFRCAARAALATLQAFLLAGVGIGAIAQLLKLPDSDSYTSGIFGLLIMFGAVQLVKELLSGDPLDHESK